MASSKSPVTNISSAENAKKKTNRGCWIVSGVGCGLMIIVAGVVVAVFVALLAGLSTYDTQVKEHTLYEGSEGKIAVVRIEGIIMENGTDGSLLGSYGSDPASFESEIDLAISDDSVKGILLRVNSPGGEVVASDMMYQTVLNAKEEKPIVTWMSSSGASGAYMIAAASDLIVAHPETITGSIGTILEVSSLEGLYEKLGIENRVFKSGEFKDESGVFDTDPNGEADQILQGLVDESYEAFVQKVADSRDMDMDSVRALADGRVYTGAQARENGLVDETGDMDDAIAFLEGLIGDTDLSVIEYNTGGFWDSLSSYERALVDRLELVAPDTHVGINMYYLLDL